VVGAVVALPDVALPAAVLLSAVPLVAVLLAESVLEAPDAAEVGCGVVVPPAFGEE
jgi:hypothetical protein